MKTDLTITKEDRDTGGRYVTTLDGHEAELTFSKNGSTAVIADHTGVPEAIGGQGVGTALVEAMVKDARENGFKIVPLCPFVAALFERNPDWADQKA
ncbi:GNAT family N-acetyltransferase [Paracoccus tegillarcae]|uniref:N-acetyltransferase n=1 Tax=Paracoccus tegillarcae TaxID=1529068 RepID=A0A2K9EHV7_9RHOB|nr:GNAT family N-acetyltransferase [Paracoccus tegillarcae]AUH34550.1 N-acetyltransferase [Paracoccus tegillarcae]